MKKTTLLLVLLCLPLALFSQDYIVDWSTGVGAAATFTVNQGETVRWNWDGVPHSVTHDSGTPAFDSGILSAGSFFEYTFNDIGSFEYFCLVHGGMRGTITVQVLGIDDELKNKPQLYPNPVTDILTIKTTNNISNIKITNVIGKTIFDKSYNEQEVQIDMTQYITGMYFVLIENKKTRQTLKVFKK